MDEQRARIQDDLRGLLAGEVRSDELFLELYASDASLYQIRPLGIVLPRSTEDVVATVQYAAANQLALHARGAGTGLAGDSLGPGLVIDFSRYMRRVLQTDESSVRVQPGLALERLNAHLAPLGRMFGPDPAMSHATTLGGVVGVDSGGSHWLRYGSARRHVESMQVVLADGTVLEVGREPIAHGDSSGDTQLRKRNLIGDLVDLLRRQASVIGRNRPKSLVNRCGYVLDGMLTDEYLELAKLLVGSEGTLALITEMTVSTVPTPRHRGVALLFFDRLEYAARAVHEIVALGPSACDLMDRRHLSLARETEPRYDVLIPPEAEALLLVEQDGDDRAEVRDRLRKIVDRVKTQKRWAFDSRQTFEDDEIDLFWQLARGVVPTLYRTRGTTRPLPFVEDVAVPPEVLGKFLVQVQNVLKRHQVTAPLFAHAGHGQLHLRPFLDIENPDDVRTMQGLAEDLYEQVLAVGGTISGEHADGLSRAPFVARQYGDLYPVFREVKRIFDPQYILNPGKKLGDTPDSLTRNLRPTAPVEAPANGNDTDDSDVPQTPLVPLQLNWSLDQLADAAGQCNGCGACRSQAPSVRMCPIFRIAPAEEASPRAKANMMRAFVTGRLDPTTLARDDFKQMADLCVNCQMCRLECPAGVDIPRLMIEGKGAYVATNGLRPTDWALSRIDRMSALGSSLRPLANWALTNRAARWVLEKLLGIAQRRKLPRFAPQTFLRRAKRRRLTRPTRRTGPKVLYFVDTYVNYHDPQLGEALVSVLEHNAVAVYVHPRQIGSGMAMISQGALDPARKVARHNVSILAEAVRQGYQIVTTEPSAALCLTRDYPALLDDDDARSVAENAREACSFLWQLHRTGKLALNFKPVDAVLGYHQPCHMRALEIGSPGENLLRLIPGLRVRRTADACSGMAGTWGLKRENFRNSLRAGWPLISSLRDTRLQAGTTECSTCKMQMEQGTTKPTIHPLKLLAYSYGLMPDVGQLLSSAPKELLVT